MNSLNTKFLRRFLKTACDELEGEWLLVGGTLLPAVGLQIRPTVDIDLIGLSESERAQSLELMGLTEKLGLGVETINQAAAYFLSKIKYGREDLFLLERGKRAEIFRPSVELYWKLKVLRLSESDLLDCQHYLRYCVGQKDRVQMSRLREVVIKELKSSSSIEKKKRLSALHELVASE